MNGLALSYGKRVNFSPYIRASSVCNYLDPTLQRTQNFNVQYTDVFEAD